MTATQPTLPGISEWRVCVRCGQAPTIQVWDDGTGMNVSCACCTISGEREGMLKTWNHEAANPVPSAYRT